VKTDTVVYHRVCFGVFKVGGLMKECFERMVVFAKVSVVFLMLFALCACENRTLTWQEQYDLGIRYLEEGNYEEAVIAFTAAIEIDPKRTGAYSGLSSAYLAMGETEKAAEIWQQAQTQTLTDAELTAFSVEEEQYERLQKFWESGETGIHIISLSFDREAYMAGRETAFSIAAFYRCPEGAECSAWLSMNVEDVNSRKFIGESVELSGSGIKSFYGTAVPVQWENRYFAVGIDVNMSVGNDFWDWIAGDTWYITPEGEISYHYAPINTYGATEFICRDRYRAFEDYSPAEQQFISSVATAAVSNDIDTIRNLLGFEFEHYERCTMWNGYKIEIGSSGEGFDDNGDRSVSATIQLRPENGTGYYYRIHIIEAVATVGTESWSDAAFIDVISCPCADWQWNGTFEETDQFYHYHTFDDGGVADSVETKTTTGTMNMSLRSGTFTTEQHRVEVWSKWPDLNKDTTTYSTKVYRDGALVEKDGKAVEQDGVCDIRDAIHQNMDNIFIRESIYW